MAPELTREGWVGSKDGSGSRIRPARIPVSHVRNREKGLVRAIGAREEEEGENVDRP